MYTKVTVKLDLDDEVLSGDEMNRPQKSSYYESVRQQVYYPYLADAIQENQREIRPDTEHADAAVVLWSSEQEDVDLSHIEGETFEMGEISSVTVDEVPEDEGPSL